MHRQHAGMPPGGPSHEARGPRRRVPPVLVVATSFALLAACGSSGRAASTTSAPATTTVPAAGASSASTTVPAPTKTILQLADGTGKLSTMLHLLDVAGLTASLSGAGPFSLLAASDAAFAKIDAASLTKLTADRALLTKVLQFSIVEKKIGTSDVSAGSIATVEGSPLALKATGGRYPSVNSVTNVAGARATNGSIFVVDTVLIPPDVTLP